MEEDVKNLFNFKGINVCNVEETLESSNCKKLFNARNDLVESLKETRHSNRDTQKTRRVIKELDFIIKANTKVDGEILLFKENPGEN